MGKPKHSHSDVAGVLLVAHQPNRVASGSAGAEDGCVICANDEGAISFGLSSTMSASLAVDGDSGVWTARVRARGYYVRNIAHGSARCLEACVVLSVMVRDRGPSAARFLRSQGRGR